jgi:large subunit ribosomal protein L24
MKNQVDRKVKLKIKKGDTIQMIAGAQKGTKAQVLEVDPKGLRIKAQGIKMMTHYSREKGLQKMEGFVDYSNVKLVQSGAAQAAAKAKGKKTKSKEAKA